MFTIEERIFILDSFKSYTNLTQKFKFYTKIHFKTTPYNLKKYLCLLNMLPGDNHLVE